MELQALHIWLQTVPVQATACRVELLKLTASSVPLLLHQKQCTDVPVLLTLILGS